MERVSELFEKGMELIRQGEYKAAEQQFLKARELAEKENAL